MALSQWDLQYLNPQEQQQILGYKEQWQGADALTRQSLNNAAEAIRARYGYSGSIDGSQYIPIDAPPQAPEFQQFQNPYANELRGIMKDLKNPQQYQSPYEDLINKQLSDIMNRPKFNYDPENDPAYQAFLQRAMAAGDKAYADNLGGLSAMTGGRPNSWAGTVASQARNQYMLQAQEAVIQFEDRAYGRYRDETQDMYNLLDVLNSQDEKAYSRFRDSFNDKKDFADLILRLDDREFEQFKYMSDENWRRFDVEYQTYRDALEDKKLKINEAIDRTNMLGYVNNQDAITLGVPAGTLSQSARERAEAMIDYVKKQQYDITQYRRQKEIDLEFDKKLITAKGASGGSGGSRPGAGDGGQERPLTEKETKTKNTELDKFDKLVSSADYNRKTRQQKYEIIENYINEVEMKYQRGAYGVNEAGFITFIAILNDISKTNAYQKDYRVVDIVNNDDTGLDW